MRLKLPARKGKPVRLETERFVLTTTGRYSAARQSFPWTRDPKVMIPLGYPPDLPYRKWLRMFARFNNRRRFCFAIRPKDTDAVIGFDRITLDGDRNATLAIMIGNRSWWGKGVVQETRRALISFAFDRLNCARVVGYVIEYNYPAVANYHMLGFRCDGILRQARTRPDRSGRVDMIAFSMLADEWKAQQASEQS